MIFRQKTQPSERRKSRNPLVVLLMGVLLTASYLASAWRGYSVAVHMIQLRHEGHTLKGVIRSVERNESTDASATTYHIVYVYQTPPDGLHAVPVKSYIEWGDFEPFEFGNLHTGDRVELVYDPQNPECSTPVFALYKPFRKVRWNLFFAVGLSLFCMVYFLHRMVQKRFVFEG